jgi:hypothetical protein
LNHSTLIATSITLFLAFTGCAPKQSNTLKASFRLMNNTTGKLLVSTVVSVFDGFDKQLPPFGGPVKSNNVPYYFADITTSINGTLDLNLSQFKEQTVLITAGKLLKYIQHQGDIITVIHYNREGNSLRVKAHYNYNLKSKLLTVIRFPEKLTEQAKEFSIIDVPMD